MARLSLARRLLKIFHPEGIPWPGTMLYNCRNFALLARPTLFKEGRARFVGALYCLVMEKGISE